MAMYMLYRSKSKSGKEMDELREKFQEIYDRHNVNIIGFWVNAEDENEVFYLSKYKDENDYKKKVESLHNDEEYVRLGKRLEEVRTSIESTKLLPMMAEA
ncbi:MAG: NIPSNAP family protein [Candidatus Thorarchaeota archaeon]